MKQPPRRATQITLTSFSLAFVVLSLAAVQQVADAGEFETSDTQKRWIEHYRKQSNVPDPQEQLINESEEPALDDGFHAIFNGKDLNGWTPHGGDSKFHVEDGCIVGVCKPGSPSTYLCTDKDDFGDFIFTAEMKFDVPTNSGIMFRAHLAGKKGNTVTGPQYEFEPDEQDRDWSGGIYGQSCGGWFYPLWLKQHRDIRGTQKPNAWNRVTIQAKGDTIKTWLNGVPAANWKTDEFMKGFFGLQIHKGNQGTVRWRNLKVKPL